mgnify:CR=1 FL=1
MKNIILKLGFFLIIEFFLAVFAFTFIMSFYDNAFIFDNSLFIETATFGVGTFLIGLYLIFFDFSEKRLKDSIKKANYKFKRFWRNLFLNPYRFFQNKPTLFIKLLIFVIASILTYKFTYIVYDMIYGAGQWDFVLSDKIFRELLLIHLVWALIRILITWFVAISLIIIIKENDK